jgi:hypothetical protein
MGSRGDEAAAKVIRAATAPRSLGPDAHLQAWAAANVIQAADQVKRWLDTGRDREDRRPFPGLPDDLTRALGGTVRAYLPDLAKSTSNFDQPGNSRMARVVPGAGGTFVIDTTRSTVTNVLTLIHHDPVEWGALQGTIDAQVVTAAEVQGRRPGARDALSGLGRLAGLGALIEAAPEAEKVDAKSRADAREAMFRKILVNSAGGAAGAAAGYAPAMPLALGIAAVTPAVSELLPIPKEGGKAGIRYTVVSGVDRFRQPLAQGLINEGVLSPTPGARWLKDGRVDLWVDPADPEGDDNSPVGNFDEWCDAHASELEPLESRAKRGYMEVTQETGTDPNAQAPSGPEPPRVRRR